MKKYVLAAAVAAIAAVPAVSAAPAGADEPCVDVFQDFNCIKPSDVTTGVERVLCNVGERLGAQCFDAAARRG